jgi:multiple sugar transport system permease protein
MTTSTIGSPAASDDTRAAAGVGTPKPLGRRLDRQRMNNTSIPLLLPAAILLMSMFVGPIIYSLYLGFTNLKLVGPTARHHRFTGL